MSTAFWEALAGHPLDLPPPVESALARTQLSDGARAILAHAARINVLKRSSTEMLSATFIVVGALSLARRPNPALPGREPGDLAEYSAISAVAGELPAIAPDFAETIRARLARTWNIGDPVPPEALQSDLKMELSGPLEKELIAPKDPPVPIGVMALLRAAVSTSRNLPRRLPPEGSARLLEVIDRIAASAPAAGFGALPIKMSRESSASTEVLRTDDYAAALATLFHTTTGELCIGIFGHWGIGKTFLARRISKFLTCEKPGFTARLSKATGVTISANDEPFGSRFSVVNFSAWKYRRTPELWVYFYETLLQAGTGNTMALTACRNAKLAGRSLLWAKAQLTRFGRILRYNVIRQGHRPLVLSLATLGIGLSPVSPVATIFGLFLFLLPLIGIGGLLWVYKTVRTSRSGVESILRRYSSLTRYTDKLGLQALVGDDLRALVCAWIPKDTFRYSRFAGEWCTLAAVAAVWLVGLTGIAGTWCSALTSLVPLAYQAAVTSICPEHTDWLRLTLQGLIWLSIFGSVVWLLHWPGAESPDRIVVIIDDLDRCGPDEIVEAMESLKLLLEDTSVSDRVQLLMLVDEGAIDHAIARKFSGLIATRAQAGGRAGQSDWSRRLWAARQEVVREHVEKLFLCHLRLPPLSADDVIDLTVAYVGEFGTQMSQRPQVPVMRLARQSTTESAPAATAGEGAGVAPTDATSSEASEGPQGIESRDAVPAGEPPPPEQAAVADTQFLFTADEGKEMAGVLANYAGADGRLISPRAIRAFMLKYQILRLLRQFAEKEVQPRMLMTALAERSFGRLRRYDDPTFAALPGQRHDVEVIVRQLV
jgi:hypothetical protein